MKKQTTKGIALAMLAGMGMGLFGCLDSGIWRQALWGAGIYAAGEFVLDNDAIFDLVESGDVPVVENGNGE